ncbi:MAG: FecR domain-containing protein [Planctomycetota bacterium]|nr:FecR domain-containing protein [Planctomycetota bacterium]
MLRNMTVMSVVLAILALPSLANYAKKPGEAKAPKADKMKVTVVSVSGTAHKHKASGPAGRWVQIKDGETLDELTIIRTGLGAKVVLQIADRGRVTIKGATKVGIGELEKKGRLVKARLGLKYGSMRARVDSSRGPNDFQVATPVATLSVRGSGLNTSFGPFGLNLQNTGGKWRMRADGKGMTLGDGQLGDGDFSLSKDLADDNRDPKMVDALGGLNKDESKSIMDSGNSPRDPAISGNGSIGPPLPFTPPPYVCGRGSGYDY